MTLTNPQVEQAKAKQKDYKLYDSNGLFLLVKTNGQKYWRAKYYFAGKENTLSLGVFPKVSLKKARSKLAEKKLMIEQDINPNSLRKSVREKLKTAHQNTFKVIALEWHNKPSGLAANTLKKRLWILEKKLFPLIGSSPISQINPPKILRALMTLENDGQTETMLKAKQVAGQVFRYAVGQGITNSDPTRDLKGQHSTRKVTNLAAITDPKEVGKLLLAIDKDTSGLVVKSLLNMSHLLFQRPGELRHMEWKEIDFAKKLWEIPAHKTKMRKAHIVPLSSQAVAILKHIQPFTGKDIYVFPCNGKRNKPASESAVTQALNRMGFSGKQTAHGFRAMARTILDEVKEFEPHIIEQQISHSVKDPLGRAYNRTAHLPQRIKMMQVWADYLDSLKREAKGGGIVKVAFKGKGVTVKQNHL